MTPAMQRAWDALWAKHGHALHGDPREVFVAGYLAGLARAEEVCERINRNLAGPSGACVQVQERITAKRETAKQCRDAIRAERGEG